MRAGRMVLLCTLWGRPVRTTICESWRCPILGSPCTEQQSWGDISFSLTLQDWTLLTQVSGPYYFTFSQLLSMGETAICLFLE